MMKKKHNKATTNKTTKSIFFYSYKLNWDKFNIIRDYTQLIQDSKNYLSEYVKNNLLLDLFYNKYSSIDFITLTKNLNVYNIGSSFYQQVQKEVYTRYITQISNIEYKNKLNSELSTTVQYLVKVYKGDKASIINYLTKGNKSHYIKVLSKINKYGMRLWNLVENIQRRLLNKFKLITFKTLCFNGINQLTISKYNFIEKATDMTLTNTIINLNIPGIKLPIAIPTQFNESYHKNLNYKQSLCGPNNCQSQTSYQCKIVNDRVKITITRDENIKSFTNEEDKYLGVDVNIKHNLFSLSDANFILYDKWLINKYYRLEKHLTKKQSNKSTEVDKSYSKATIKRINKMNRISKSYNDLKSRELINYCLNNNYNHIVMEDLDLNKSKSWYSYEYKLKYNNMIKTLHLNDYKNTIKRIGNKFNITVSFTNPEYTSQTCSKCGYISKSNRKLQETFSCIKCQYTLNADYNSAINIQRRVSDPYLRDILHDVETDVCKHYVGKKYISRNTYVTTYKSLHK